MAGYRDDYFASSNHLEWGYRDYFEMEKSVRSTARLHLDAIKGYGAAGPLLEIGCATGWFLDEARSRGYEVRGVELSDFAAGWGRENLGLSIFSGVLKDAGFPAETFGTVVLWDVLEHVTDPLRELSEINRVLKRGGYLFASLPDVGSPLARLMGRRWFGYAKIKEHMFYFSREAAAQALKATGFELLGIQKSQFVINGRFMAQKVSQYSRPLAGLLEKAIAKTGLAEAGIRFRALDMLVVARKA